MPFYFTSAWGLPNAGLSVGTSGVPQGRFTTGTGATAPPNAFTGLFAAATTATAGGAVAQLCQFATPSTTGTLAVAGATGFPTPRIGRATALATVTSARVTPTAGSGNVSMFISVGYPATGGMGGWIATDPDNWIVIAPGGTTTAIANLELWTIATNATTTSYITVEFCELA
jgi:hypothetical protein